MGPRGCVLLEFVLEGVLSKILHHYYMPQIRQMLNSDILVNKLLTGE